MDGNCLTCRHKTEDKIETEVEIEVEIEEGKEFIKLKNKN
jgi:hypothetical protein